MDTSPNGMYPVIYQAIVIGLELMVDPMSFITNAGTILTSRKSVRIRSISFAVSSLVMVGLMVLTGYDLKSQVDTVWWQLGLKSADMIQYLRYAGICIIYFILIGCVRRAYAVIAQCSQTDIHKYDRR